MSDPSERTKSTPGQTLPGMRNLPVLAVAVGAALGLVLTFQPSADASRNSSGTYTLPTGNPVVPGTTISSTWANSTLGDISTELTDSLSRSGRGAMLAPLKLNAGSAAAPGLSWDVDPDTGLYRPSAGTAAMAADATQVQTWTAAGTNFKRPANFDVGLVADGGVVTTTLSASGAAALNGATTLGSTLSVSGVANFAVPANFNNGAAAMMLRPGTADHTYMSFYADSDNPTVRSGYFGFPGPGGTSMEMVNEMAGGIVRLAPAGGEILAVANKVTLSGVNPASTAGFGNALTPKNIVKAWASISTPGGGSTTATIMDGFNVTGATSSGSSLTVTLATGMANSNYAILVTPFASTLACSAVFTNATSFLVTCRNISGSTLPFPFYDFQATSTSRIYVAVLGAQ